jgi:hypothetical protein
VIDIAIPDASQMSADLITYLNTVKAAGVQIAWHTTMDFKVVVGYFESDSIVTNFQMYFDIFIKRENEVANAFRTACEWWDVDSEYRSAISESGYLSGTAFNRFEVAEYRDFEPFRMLLHITQASPLIKLDYLADFLEKDFDEMTVGEAEDLELAADRQIPNIDLYYGKILVDEMRPYEDTNILGIIEEFGDNDVGDISRDSMLNNVTIKDYIDQFKENTVALKHVVSRWNEQKYLNKDLNTSPLSICTGPIQILTITEA